MFQPHLIRHAEIASLTWVDRFLSATVQLQQGVAFHHPTATPDM